MQLSHLSFILVQIQDKKRGWYEGWRGSPTFNSTIPKFLPYKCGLRTQQNKVTLIVQEIILFNPCLQVNVLRSFPGF